MKTFLRPYTALVLLFFSISFAPRGYAQQVQKGLTASNGQYVGFLQFTPPDYNDGQKHPLIIFLHGMGERGDGTSQLSMVAANPIPALLTGSASMKFTYAGVTASYCVLSPQLSSSYGNWQDFYVDEMLKYAKQNLNIDTTRIYLAGLSLGGGGVWHYASSSLAHAQSFAAIAPVCGIYQLVDPANITNAMLPLWAFHAVNDGTVSYTNTVNQVKAVNQIKPGLALQTLYGSGDHYIWTRVFDTAHKVWDTYPSGTITQNPNIFEWFLQFRRMPVGTPQAPVARAGFDTVLTLPTTSTTLNGSLSYDPDGNIVSYSWSKISGPAQYALGSPAAAVTTIGSLVEGSYTFRLTVTDNSGTTTYDDINLTVKQPGNMSPISNAGTDVTITLPTNSATLNGSASYDPDGSLYQYQWTQLSGPSTATIASAATASTSVGNLVQGSYKFSLRVWDNTWTPNAKDDTVMVTVNGSATNQLPVANAGSNITITLPTSSTTLNGAGSYDPDGTISTYSWAWVSGPSQYTIANAGSASTALSNLVQGTYIFKLTVTDDKGANASANVQVLVNAAIPPPNQSPVANAGSDAVITLPASSVTLNGAASYDPDGTISSYSWTWVSGPSQYTIATPSAASTTVSNLAQGTYVFKLTVMDNLGYAAIANVQVTVNAAPPPPNQLPVANAGTNITITLPTSSATLSGSGSDPDGTISSYSWSLANGPSQYAIASPGTASTTVSNLVQGTYTFKLTVTDNNGATASATVQVIVNAAAPPPNQSPMANAGSDVVITLPINSITLNGASSYDPDGTITSYNWSWVSGPSQYAIATPSASSTAVSNLVQGTYVFRLTVTDNNSYMAIANVQVIVNAAPPPPNQLPVANPGSNITITLPTSSATLNGAGSYDPDGTISSYSWSLANGPSQYTIATPGAASATVSNLVQGTYTFKLTVTDNNGAPASATVQVIVNAAPPPPNKAPVAIADSVLSITLPLNTATLDGSRSSDPDGTIASYSWTWVSGPSQYNIANSGASITAVSNLVPGTYRFRLQISDDKGATATTNVTITVNPRPNAAPVARAGNDQYVSSGQVVTLDGSSSYDPDGVIKTYSWSLISGAGGAVTIVNASTFMASVTGLRTGDYTFELTVTDDNGAVSRDQVKVFVNASTPPGNMQGPVAVAGRDSTISIPQNYFLLDGSYSYEIGGSIKTYVWKQLSGPSYSVIDNATSVQTLTRSLVEGSYTFELTVSDEGGAVGRDTIMITIVNTLRSEENLLLYPNPATDNLNIRCMADAAGQVRVTIMNASGQTVKVLGASKGQSYFNMFTSVRELKAGLYYLEVNIDNKTRMVSKFIKL